MKSSSNNPAENALGAGVTSADVAASVDASGYPLQTRVALMLGSSFIVREEWSYRDSDSEELRTIDLVANQSLWDIKGPQPHIRPALSLVVECKQSTLPYVFFVSPPRWQPDFPGIAGLAKTSIPVTSDSDPSTSTHDIMTALGLREHPFLMSAPLCSTFSKCVRKGRDLELSGSEAFQGLMLPLLKAASHFGIVEWPPSTAVYFDAHLVVACAVLDAPMVAVEVSRGGHEEVLIPWVRAVRHEHVEGEHRWYRPALRAVDIVHSGFLREYLDKHLLPFAAEFARRAIKHQAILVAGEAFVAGENVRSANIEPHLQRRGAKARLVRGGLIARNIARFLIGRRSASGG